MKQSNFRISVLFLTFILVFTVASYSQDWPQWLGVNRNANVSGFKAPATWPKELQPEWKITVGLGDAGPVLADNKLYAFTRQGDNEIILCLDAISGKELWQNKYSATVVSGPAATHPGPRSTPVVAEGKIVTLGVGGVLSCLDAKNGNILWRKENSGGQVPKFFTGMSPIIYDGLCVAYLGGDSEGTIVAFDLKSGNEKWKWTGEGPTYSSPEMMNVDGKKQLVFVTSKNLIGLDAGNGKLLWQVDAPCQNRFYNAATPVISGQTVFLTGLGSGTKAFKIGKQGDTFVATELWSNPELGTKYNTPVIQDGFLYGLSNGRKFFCLDAAKGQTMWTDTLMNSDFGTIINCGSAIMAVPSNSNLIFFKPSGKAYSELMRVKISDKPVYATPVVQENKIYIKDAENLALYKIAE